MENWRVLLLGGASGSGKSALSYPVARARGAALVEVDDLVVALQSMTTADRQPALHYWLGRSDAGMSADQVLDAQVALARALAPALEAVITNHLETDLPLVLEGDYLLPEFCAKWTGGDVRSVFVHEPDAAQLERNYLRREPDSGAQRKRALDSAHYGDWLAAEAARHRLPVITARPWSDALDRLTDAVRQP
ncbi:2-phosphoglycerate kinase [Saccharothrix tamanrassetensis]|uniref:2-phosphoglycerate kinase n=1 Tax=Saccharothrix tamanrassetensis TaxID=1051531 RepID=A0A841CHK4_9PSEU|nr:hypothetical protein [Saccharothrix tamanrassetensis]MBB5958022.1 2-phosphoglycerate kinase [Saccharothrix tamanrassetensis]